MRAERQYKERSLIPHAVIRLVERRRRRCPWRKSSASFCAGQQISATPSMPRRECSAPADVTLKKATTMTVFPPFIHQAPSFLQQVAWQQRRKKRVEHGDYTRINHSHTNGDIYEPSDGALSLSINRLAGGAAERKKRRGGLVSDR